MARDLNHWIKIGDFKKVDQKVICYEAGEVAHIENVMIGETRERKNTYLEREEHITETEIISEEEQERDTQTSERYAMQRESQKIMSQDTHFDVDLSVKAEYKPVSITANTGFQMGMTTQQADKASSEYSKDVIERARNRTFKRTRSFEKLTVIKQWEDINTHNFKNEPLPGEDKSNNIGIYRWVDKKYENKLLNYGRRLMLNLNIPDPAAWHRRASTMLSSSLHLPDDRILNIKPSQIVDTTPTSLNEINYLDLVKLYPSSISPAPNKFISIEKPFSYATLDTFDFVKGLVPAKGTAPTETTSLKDDTIKLPEGYFLDHLGCGANFYSKTDTPGHLFVRVENHEIVFNSSGWQYRSELWTEKRSSLAVSIQATSYVDSYIVNLVAVFQRTPELYSDWQIKTYNTLRETYERQLSEYERKLEELKAMANMQYGNNPSKNRMIEAQELKKGAITLLANDPLFFENFNSTFTYYGYPYFDQDQSNSDAVMMEFFENAFDWDIISYKFYPYFWQFQYGDLSNPPYNWDVMDRGRWAKVYSIRDNDDVFEKFLQAGYANVVVPVKLGYEKMVLNFLENDILLDQNFTSKIPVVKQALVDLTTNVPTYDKPREIEKWYTKAPTNLVILQTSAKGAPGDGLPCWESTDPRLNPDLITLDQHFGPLGG